MNYYDSQRVSSTYDKVRTWNDRFIPERIARIIGCRASSLVLDIACGTGNLGLAVERFCSASFAGVDLSMSMLGEARGKTPRPRFVQADCSRLPFLPASFDAVIGSFFLHHIPELKRPSVFQEIHRVLSQGTCAIVTSSHEQISRSFLASYFPEIGEIDCRRFPEIETILGWLEACGFHSVRAEVVRDLPVTLNPETIRKIENKVVSTLDLISPAAFEKGLERLREHARDPRRCEQAWERDFTIICGSKT